jgi:arsenite methyltransferase
MSEQALKAVIQQKYGEAAIRATTGQEKGGCCGTSCGCGDPITSNLYGADEAGAVPARSRRRSAAAIRRR